MSEKIPKKLMSMAWILVIGGLPPMLDSTMVNIAIPNFVTVFHSTLSQVQWVTSIYLLALSIAIPFSGWLINHFDGRIAYLSAQLIFLVGSISASLSSNLSWLIIARVIQGFGAGLIVPMLTTLLVQMAGPHFKQVMAVVSLPMMIGPVLGPSIGGLIMNSLSWQWIFIVNVPVIAIAIIGIFWKLPAMPAQNKKKKFDFVGTALFAGFTTSLIYAVVEGGKDFWNDTTRPYILLGLALFILYIIWAYFRKEKAVLPLHIFTYRSYVGATMGLILFGVVMNGTAIMLTTYFQAGRGFSALDAAFAILPQGLGMFLSRIFSRKLMDVISLRSIVMGAAVLVAGGLFALTTTDENTSLVLISAILFVIGAGTNDIFMPLMIDAYTGMPKSDVPEATIGTRIFQNIGGAYGTSIVSIVVANQLTHLLTVDHYHFSPHVYTLALQSGFLLLAVLALLVILPASLLNKKK